jgi:hypothetical protein
MAAEYIGGFGRFAIRRIAPRATGGPPGQKMGPFVGNTADFAQSSALETGLSVARTKTDSLLLPHCALECLFNAGNFALEAPRMAFSVVDFDRTGNTVAIRS